MTKPKPLTLADAIRVCEHIITADDGRTPRVAWTDSAPDAHFIALASATLRPLATGILQNMIELTTTDDYSGVRLPLDDGLGENWWEYKALAPIAEWLDQNDPEWRTR